MFFGHDTHRKRTHFSMAFNESLTVVLILLISRFRDVAGQWRPVLPCLKKQESTYGFLPCSFMEISLDPLNLYFLSETLFFAGPLSAHS